MALTAFETAEQRLPCHVEQADGGSKVVAAEQAVSLQETDHGGDGDRMERDDIWNMIQSQKPAATAPKQAPYVPAPVRRSSSLLSQKSLEICTESLGSETGSDGFSEADVATDRSCPGSDNDCEEGANGVAARAMPPRAFPPPLPSLARRTVGSRQMRQHRRDGFSEADVAIDRSCPGSDDDCEEGANGVAARAMPPWAFPPPLPSLARRTVGSQQMRQHRRDGRLVAEAVPVLSNTLFRAERRGGRLLLSFADSAAPASDEEKNHGQETDQQPADEQTHEEEEVEVVDRGTVVEVKASTQAQAHSSGARVVRSSLIINKFVGAEPVNTSEINDTAAEPPQPHNPPRCPGGSTTTAAAALASASALSATATLPEGDGTSATPCEGKVLMTTRRRRSNQELLNHMRRCGQLFIWEPRVATSS